MRLHRFYVDDQVELTHDLWLHDNRLINQWQKVLRFQPGQEVVLFDGQTHDRLYKITEIKKDEAHLIHITDFVRKVPPTNTYLFWSLLKKDKNDWVLQKCTELGVSHFVPLLADRSEKTGFNVERAEKIIIEAAEQCGRSDIPTVREPFLVGSLLEEFKSKLALFVCEQGEEENNFEKIKEVGILIGPEGGWSEQEQLIFKKNKLKHLNLHDFTLRAETAAVAAISKII